MPPINLPRFTFINGPRGVGKTTLARLLQQSDPNTTVVAFAEPIRSALCAVFYPTLPLDPPDLRDQTVKARFIPGTNVSHHQWMIAFSSFMKSTHNKYIFGELARRTCEELEQYYSRFVFDDCRYLDEINPFSLAYGRENCLLLHLSRHGKSWDSETFDIAGRQDGLTYPGTSHIALSNNGDPNDLLTRLADLLRPKQPSLARR